MRYSKVFRNAEPALGLHLRYGWEPGEQRGATLANPLFDLLTAVLQDGSIRQAAQSLGCSYRHVWGSLRKWEQLLGEPLIVWSQGHRARPTQFAERLLWAERRARTRLQPHIEALRLDLVRVIAEASDQRHQLLTVQASHDMALSVLQQHAAETADLHLNIRFQGSEDALRGLNHRQCLVAGFHVPVLRGAAPVFAKALKPLLKPGKHKLIGCSRRMQGLMVRREHAPLIRTFPDVIRHHLRFVNRQVGSGTRMLIDHLMHEHSIEARDLPGFDGLTEQTHVAVALCVASGIADAGIGVEAAALEFGLHFAPLVEENYFLACLKENLSDAAVQRLCSALAGSAWREILANLAGYRPAQAPGKVLVMTEALPWWPKIKSRPKPPKARRSLSHGESHPEEPAKL
ncbi:MAG: helix-turn-helix transcriptional regulator [Pseudomonadota bacterium]|nr:helix-turn-helix transcriptional regulator [Pseudomonadota bacterium]